MNRLSYCLALAAFVAISSCSLRNDTAYYRASYTPPSDLELEIGLNKPRGMTVEPTESYPDDSVAVTKERYRLERLVQLAESKERIAQTTPTATMRDSIRLANESKVHRQILSEKHVIIAIDDAGKEESDTLFRKIELFGFDSQEVSDFIKDKRLAVRFYQLD